MSFEGYARLYEGRWNDVSQVLERAVDSGIVHSDQRAIWTNMESKHGGVDKVQGRQIRAVAMLGGGRSAGASYEVSCRMSALRTKSERQ